MASPLLLLLLVLALGAEGTNLEKETKTGEENVRGGENAREGKTRDVGRLLDTTRRCKWSVGGIDRYVVEGEVMEEGGNRWECLEGRMTILGAGSDRYPLPYP